MITQLTAIVAAIALASPSAGLSVLHERRDGLPRTWLKSEKVPGGTIIPMRIGLVQSNLDKGHDLLMDV